jgi:hypothetical protein
MRVYINNYKNHWVSPYKILDYIFFWTDWSKCSRNWSLKETLEDENRLMKDKKSKYVEHPEWVEVWAERLMPISKAIQWVWDKVDRKINYVKIDRWDTWSMDHTLSYIILPMLKQLRETTHGSPLVDDEDVPDELKSTSAPPKENEWDTDSNHHKRWMYVLNEMIFAFERKVDDSWEDNFRSGEIDWVSVPIDKDGNEVPKGEHLYYKMKEGPNHTYECDYDAIAIVHKRMENGFRLFGRYYSGLWD